MPDLRNAPPPRTALATALNNASRAKRTPPTPILTTLADALNQAGTGYMKRQGDYARQGWDQAVAGGQKLEQGDLTGLIDKVAGPANWLASPINALVPSRDEIYAAGKGSAYAPALAALSDVAMIGLPGPDGTSALGRPAAEVGGAALAAPWKAYNEGLDVAGVKYDPTRMNMFIGPKAVGFPLEKIAVAEKLEGLGHSAADIHDMTGLHRGKDGNWRAEISDQGMSIKKDPRNWPDWGLDADQAVSHPKMFAAYPDLAVINLKKRPGDGGDYTPSRTPNAEFARDRIGDIRLGEDAQDPVSYLAHEFQHAIQQIEGFAPGASPGEMQRALFNGDLNGKVKPGGDTSAYGLYQRSAGETEARNTQSRLMMSEERRAASYPQSTEDVPNYLQILYDRQKGPSYSTNSLGKGLAELMASATPAEQLALKARLEAEAAQTGGVASGVAITF